MRLTLTALLSWTLGFATAETIKSERFRAGSGPSAAIARFLAAEDVREHAHYAFLDDGRVSNPTRQLFGHASFDVSVDIGGTNDIDHHHSYQDASVWNGSGTLRRMASMHAHQVVTDGHVIEAAGLYFLDPKKEGGEIDIVAAVRVPDLTAGKQNYSLLSTGRAKMLQAGELQVGGGVVVGAPLGGNKGADTINVSGDYYRNGTAMGAQIDALQKTIDALTARLVELEAARK